jgi:hypothetical protein
MGGMRKKKPDIIKEINFDFRWDNKKVWHLDEPVENMEISELDWLFDIPLWHSPGGYYDFKPIWVIENPGKYPERYKRIMEANLDWPIDIMEWKGRWLLLDGLHRLTKAKILGRKKVKVRKIPKTRIPEIKIK